MMSWLGIPVVTGQGKYVSGKSWFKERMWRFGHALFPSYLYSILRNDTLLQYWYWAIPGL